MVSTPFVPVPPPFYGGTELVVAELVDGLTAAGHQVTLFTCGRSDGKRVRALYQDPQWPPDPYPEIQHAAWALGEVIADGRFDVVHAHLPAALPLARFVDVPMVYTVHHERDPRLQSLYAQARVQLVAISARQKELQPELAAARVIHHGLSPARYDLGCGGGGYAVYLGRLSPGKGVHLAIDVAQAAGVPLRIAGRPHPGDGAYFAGEVRPRLGRPGVDHLGQVGGRRKIGLLCEAIALLFPISWEEPFGLVMIEAMLCGTPVLAFARGATPEVVEPGVTGFLCGSTEEMAERLAEVRAGRFDRERCRARASERFGTARMVGDHLRLYRQLAGFDEDEDARRADAAPHA